MPNSSQLRSSVSTCTRRELVLDARRDGRAVGGRVVVGGRERAVGPAHAAAGQAQPVERLRARHLVDEVQVDVEQGGRAEPPRGPPRSCRTSSLAWSSAPLLVGGWCCLDEDPCRGPAVSVGPPISCASARRRRPPERRPPRWSGFSKWCGRSASKVTQSPSLQLVALGRRRRARASRCSTRAVSRLPGSCIGGSSTAPVAPPGASVWRRELGALAGLGGGQDLELVAAAPVAAALALAGADDRHRAVLVQAQQLGEPQIEPGGDTRGDGERGARLPPLDLGEHRRAHAGAHGEVAQGQRGGLAQRLHPRPDDDGVKRVRTRCG